MLEIVMLTVGGLLVAVFIAATIIDRASRHFAKTELREIRALRYRPPRP